MFLLPTTFQHFVKYVKNLKIYEEPTDAKCVFDGSSPKSRHNTNQHQCFSRSYISGWQKRGRLMMEEDDDDQPKKKIGMGMPVTQ